SRLIRKESAPWLDSGYVDPSGGTNMPRWLTDKMTWLVIFAAIAAASSSYSAYKIYLMTYGKPAAVVKGKREIAHTRVAWIFDEAIVQFRMVGTCTLDAVWLMNPVGCAKFQACDKGKWRPQRPC